MSINNILKETTGKTWFHWLIVEITSVSWRRDNFGYDSEDCSMTPHSLITIHELSVDTRRWHNRHLHSSYERTGAKDIMKQCMSFRFDGKKDLCVRSHFNRETHKTFRGFKFLDSLWLCTFKLRFLFHSVKEGEYFWFYLCQ